MSNISVSKRDGNGRQPAETIDSLSPFRVMRRIMGWDPFREMAPLVPADDQGFVFSPPFEVKETKDDYEFRADVPGLTENDIEITITGNRLTVSGKREAEKESTTDAYFVSERTYGAFVRGFTLPEGADAENVRATLADGVLALTVPKKPETQAKKVPVSTASVKVQS